MSSCCLCSVADTSLSCDDNKNCKIAAVSWAFSMCQVCTDLTDLCSSSNFILPSQLNEGVFSSVQSLSCVQLFATPWTAAHQASLSITNSGSLLKLMSIQLMMPFNHLILSVPFSSCFQSFLASGSFPTSQFFTPGSQSIGVSIHHQSFQ